MYYLMNKDKVVATFRKSEDPLVGGFEIVKADNEALPIGFKDINSWLENRQVGKHKKHIRDIMAECGCLSTEGYIRITHGTTLNDTFWVKSEGESVKWEQVSLYVNEFDDVIARISFEGSGLYGQIFSTTTPEFSTEGSFEKCWRREPEERKKNNIFLYKRGTSGARNAGLEPFSEVYSSQLGKALCDAVVPYQLSVLHGKIASKCELFTSENIGFAPLSLIAQKRMTPREMLDFYASIGSEEEFRRMIIFDALTFNTDRHMGNHGVIFNTDTLEIIKMAPIFDENLSLLPYAEADDFKNIGAYLKTREPAIGEDFVQLSKVLMTKSIRAELINLKDFQFNIQDNEKFPVSRVRVLEELVARQINGILDRSKIYTADVFPESALTKLKKNQKEIEEKDIQSEGKERAVPEQIHEK